ncbi:MAG: SpoIIE family protein phosphatase [Flavobacteriales bacterium]|nr:SpoIIE family protein phosphatase [Flavobacteriales bacterium]
MKRVASILTILMLAVFPLHAQDNWNNIRDEFVTAVNQGSDEALFIGKNLISKLENLDTIHPIAPRVYLSMGNYYLDRERLPDALFYYQKTLDIAEELGDATYMAYANGSIGNVYAKSGRYAEALPVFRKNLNYWQQQENQALIPVAINNIGRCWLGMGQLQPALDTLLLGYSFCEEHQVSAAKPDLAYNLGRVYLEKGAGGRPQAKAWILKSLNDVQKDQKEQLYKAQLLMAQLYLDQGNWAPADTLSRSVYEALREDKKYQTLYIEACRKLAITSGKLGNPELAMHYQWEYSNQKDSLDDRFQLNQLMQLELEHNLHKELAMDSMRLTNQEQELELNQQLERDRLQYVNWIGILLLLLVTGTGFYVYRSYQQQKVTFKKLTEVNKEITDSINYAKHIQDAFLPHEAQLLQVFPESMIFYKPKDVVAGDFYWIHEVGNKLLIVVGDCILNGVPGAMASVVYQGAVHKATQQAGVVEPAAILNRTQELINQRFAQTSEANDGVDIAICLIDKQTNTLQFAGANNNLRILSDQELKTLSGDPGSMYPGKDRKFTNTSHTLQPGELIVISTDGLEQQIPDVLDDLRPRIGDIGSVKQHLQQQFEEQLSQQGQLDDVCVIGVKV